MAAGGVMVGVVVGVLAAPTGVLLVTVASRVVVLRAVTVPMPIARVGSVAVKCCLMQRRSCPSACFVHRRSEC